MMRHVHSLDNGAATHRGFDAGWTRYLAIWSLMVALLLVVVVAGPAFADGEQNPSGNPLESGQTGEGGGTGGQTGEGGSTGGDGGTSGQTGGGGATGEGGGTGGQTGEGGSTGGESQTTPVIVLNTYTVSLGSKTYTKDSPMPTQLWVNNKRLNYRFDCLDSSSTPVSGWELRADVFVAGDDPAASTPIEGLSTTAVAGTDGKAQVELTGNKDLPGEGTYELRVRAEGKEEPLYTASFSIDATEPVVNLSLTGNNSSTPFYEDGATLEFEITEANIDTIVVHWLFKSDSDAPNAEAVNNNRQLTISERKYEFKAIGLYSDVALIVTDKAGNSVTKNLGSSFEVVDDEFDTGGTKYQFELIYGNTTLTSTALGDGKIDYINSHTPQLAVKIGAIKTGQSTIEVINREGDKTIYTPNGTTFTSHTGFESTDQSLKLSWAQDKSKKSFLATIPSNAQHLGIPDGAVAIIATLVTRRNKTEVIEVGLHRYVNNANEEVSEPSGLLVIDTIAPQVGSLVWYNTDARNRKYYAAKRTATVTITETNFDEGAANNWVHYGTGSGQADSVTWSHEGDTHVATLEFSSDGAYAFIVSGSDLANNPSNEVDADQFVIDQTSPVVKIKWDETPVKNTVKSAETGVETEYYAEGRTATITITETNLPGQDANSETGYDDDAITVSWIHYAEDSDKAQSTKWIHQGNTHVATLEFANDGKYHFTVSGQDLAKNASNVADSGRFVIDTIAPVIRLETGEKTPYETYEGKKYYRKAAVFEVVVKELNFDADYVSVIAPGGKVVRQDDGSTWVSDGEKHKLEVLFDTEGDYNIIVFGTDLAMNPTKDEAGNSITAGEPLTEEFVVDQTGPRVTSVTVNRDPASTANDNEYYFYNKKARMVIDVVDNYPIAKGEVACEGLSFYDSIDVDQLVDPDGVYDAQLVLDEDRKAGTVTVTLLEGKGSEAHRLKEFENNVILTIWDVAGNMRTWSIGPEGTVSDYNSESSTANTSINNEGIYPATLVLDTTAPVLSYAGPEEGKFYNTNQSMTLGINEYNFGYLQRFDGARLILTISSTSGDASRSKSTVEVTAKEFKGKDPSYSYPYTFDTDGHYVIDASFSDYATNKSNIIHIGEFTIDKTPPIIEVVWDNNDVQNGMYYMAGRVATITVTEHNFDESLFKVETTGQTSGWSHSGDTHTMTVWCTEDGGVYSLKVSGVDQAQNAAVEYYEPEFIVDLSSPEISFGGEFGNHTLEKAKVEGVVSDATNGVVKPTITYTDKPASNGSEPFNAYDTSYEIVRLDGGSTDDINVVETDQDVSGGVYNVSFNDFGLTEYSEELGTSYTLVADGVYQIKAHVVDLAGNEADNDIIFSVNRYGSSFIIESVYTYDAVEKEHSEEIRGKMAWLDKEPAIVVRAVDVSKDAEHYVTVERPDAQTPTLEAISSSSVSNSKRLDYEGYTFSTINDGEKGWYEYVYRIGSGNFGSGHGGEGAYTVTVSSKDTAGNTSTAESFYDREGEGTISTAQVSFFLDSIGPKIQVIQPNWIEIGDEYELQFQVIDEQKFTNEKLGLTIDDVVLDDNAVEALRQEGALVGPDSVGNYTLKVAHKTIREARRVEVVATDWIGRSADDGTSSFRVTNLVLEILCAVAILGSVTTGTALYVYRRQAKGSQGGSWYE